MLRALALFALALGLLLSPVAMRLGGGMAMAHAPLAISSGDCAGMDHASPDEEGTSDAEMSCALSCAAIAGLPTAIADRAAPAAAETVRAVPPALSGIRPESETPPPRGAPRI